MHGEHLRVDVAICCRTSPSNSDSDSSNDRQVMQDPPRARETREGPGMPTSSPFSPRPLSRMALPYLLTGAIPAPHHLSG